jgi:hypothetical protein
MQDRTWKACHILTVRRFFVRIICQPAFKDKSSFLNGGINTNKYLSLEEYYSRRKTAEPTDH